MNKDQILKLYNQGFSYREISRQLDIPYSTINYQAKKLGLVPRDFNIGELNKVNGLSDQTKEKLRQAALERYQDKTNHPMTGRKHSNEAKAKMSESGRGVNKRAHLPEWDGTKTNESQKFYNSEAWKEIQKLVFIRDNFTCALTNQVGGNLECHHIIPRTEDLTLWFDLDNLITLSKKAHRNFHAQERKLGKQQLLRDKLYEVVKSRMEN